MQAFETAQLLTAQHESGKRYHEFFRNSSLSMGIYNLPAGGTDPQQPHTEDEVYVVVSGAALIRVEEEDRAVSTGSIVFVAAGQQHYFRDIRETLSLLVFFAPAEGTQERPA